MLAVVRYSGAYTLAGLLSMPVFLLLSFLYRKHYLACKPMGCGAKGGFGAVPSLHLWAVLVVAHPHRQVKLPRFCERWFGWFGTTLSTYTLSAFQAHGSWDGQEIYGRQNQSPQPELPVAILTRATIRNRSIRAFFKEVDAVAHEMQATPGFVYSIGIGEIPWKKQATFSVWQNLDAVKQFAYRMQHHAAVVRKTRKEDWYSEEMFVRFTVHHHVEKQLRP